MPYHDTTPPTMPTAVTAATTSIAVPAVPATAATAPAAAPAVDGVYAFESVMTYNEGHDHEYVIDINGNGMSDYACHPMSDYICHQHVVVNSRVVEAHSACYPNCKSLYGHAGVPPHIHELSSIIESDEPEMIYPQATEDTPSTVSDIVISELLLENNSIEIVGSVFDILAKNIRVVAAQSEEVSYKLSGFFEEMQNFSAHFDSILLPRSGMSFHGDVKKDFFEFGELHVSDAEIVDGAFKLKIDNILVENYLSLKIVVHLDGEGHMVFSEVPIFGKRILKDYVVDLRKNQKTAAKLQIKTNQGKREKIEKKEKSDVGRLEIELGDKINAIKKKKELYWGKFYNTFDEDGNLRYVFSFDYASFCEKNALFPSLVSDANMDNILDIILARRRVKYPATEEHIEYSNSPSIGVENISFSNSTGFMTLSGVDREVNPASTYKYKIAILMTDRTTKMAQQILDRLIQLKTMLEDGNRANIISELYTIILNLYYGTIPDEYDVIKRAYNNPKDSDAYDNRFLKLIEEGMQNLITNIKNKLDSVKKTGKVRRKATPSTGPNYMSTSVVDPAADSTSLSESTGPLPRRIFDIEYEFPDIIKFSEASKISLNFRDEDGLGVITKNNFLNSFTAGIVPTRTTEVQEQRHIKHDGLKPIVEFFSEIKTSRRPRLEKRKELTLMSSNAIVQRDLNAQLSAQPTYYTFSEGATLAESDFEYASNYKNDTIIGDNNVTLLEWLPLNKENVESLITNEKIFVRVKGAERVTNKYFLVEGE